MAPAWGLFAIFAVVHGLGSGAAPETPGSRGMKLRPRDGGTPFYWFNTHFEAFSGRVRRESARLLRERISKIAAAMPCVVTGDFNTGPDLVRYRTLLAEQSPPSSSLHDVFRAARPVATLGEGTIHFFAGWRIGPRIDWILASSHFQTIDADIDRTRWTCGSIGPLPVTATLRVR